MTISFTGHRDYDRRRFAEPLSGLIRELAERESVTFWSGMAVGFDIAAAEEVLALRSEGYDVKLCCAVAFRGQADSFGEEYFRRYSAIIESADRVEILADTYTSGVYHQRNDFLVDRADRIIAYYNGVASGGTHYTVRRAKRKGIAVDNLFPQSQLSLF